MIRARSWSSFLRLVWIVSAMLCVGILRGHAQTPAPAEIVELARALKHDPDLIYEHVYNNIETLPQYGSLKGPLGALLDGKGTAFDQAELMVALLQQSGHTASFQIGMIERTAAQLTNWLGVDTSPNSVSVTLGTGGFSGQLFVSGGNVVRAEIGWAWIRVSIGGTNYVFDPATKSYNRSTGIGAGALASALGYSESEFTTDALSGATVAFASITNLNRSNIRNRLTSYSGNLVNYIRANNPAISTADLIGGTSIAPLTLGTQLRQTSLSYQSASPPPENFATIPAAFRTTLTLRLGWNVNESPDSFTPLTSSITFNSSDIYNHRLVVSFNAASLPSLLFDGVPQLVASGTVPAQRQLTVRVSIDHPYPENFADQAVTDAIRVTPVANLIYLIGTGWGSVGRGTIEKHRRLVFESTESNPGNPTAEPVLGESLAMIGYTWLAEVAQFQLLMDRVAGTTTVYQHAVGVVGMKAVGGSSGPYVDLPLNRLGTVQRTARPTSSATLTPIESAVFFAGIMFSSIAESGVLEQTQPTSVAVSTVKLLDIAIQSGTTIYDINNGAIPDDNEAYYISQIRPVLQTSYLDGDLARINALVSGGSRIIAPANGAIVVNAYTGVGYYSINQAGTSIGAIISGGLSGGFPTGPVPPAELIFNTPEFTATSWLSSGTTVLPSGSFGNAGGNLRITPTSNDPINLVTGDYLYSVTDLSVGSQDMPIGLSFQRYYDSGTRFRSGSLGPGWTHNFAIRATPDSDAFAGMAAISPISGAVAIAAAYVTFDLLNDASSKPLDRILMASVVQRWLMVQLTDNTVVVAQPGFVEHFTKLADGSYNPPPASASKLTKPGPGFQYVTKTRDFLDFNAAGDLSTWSMASGAKLTLTYAGTPEVLASVSNNLGRSLSFTYSSGLLTRVADDSGRAVTYAYDASDNLTRVTDVLGQDTRYVYDLPGRLTQVFSPAFPTIPFVTNAYDSLGRVGLQEGADKPAWRYFFAGSRSEEVDPFGSRHVLYSTPFGKTRAEIRDLGGLNIVTTSTYDALNRLVSTIAPEGGAVAYTYDINSNVLTSVATPKPGSPLSPLSTTYSYDSVFNKPTRIVDPRGLVTTSIYDQLNGNLLSVTADAGDASRFNATSNFTYNPFGQVVTATDPLGTVTRNSYDAAGNRLSITRDFGSGSQANQVTSFAYDGAGNVVSATDPKGNVTTTTYDVARRPVTTTLPATSAAPGGLSTALSYDPDGRVVQTQVFAGGVALRTTSTTYTPTGKPQTATDANGNVTRFSYDAVDRVSTVTDAEGRTARTSYDALGRRSAVFNAAIQTAPLLQFGYTADGQLGSLIDANGNTTSFAYDGFDRLATTTYPGGSTETATYDADGNVLTRKTRANQTITYTYDTLNRLATRTPPSPAAVVTYRYDLANRLTGTSDTSAAIAAAVPPSGSSVQYTTSLAYDALNRPTTIAWDPAPAPASPSASSVTFTHAYNKVNQRIGQSLTDNTWLEYPPATPSTVSYTANALNQYTAVGAVTPTYDGNGNLTSDGTFALGYDSENRLTSASGAGNTASYAYDAHGRRKSKTVNGSTTVFVTAADNREMLEYDGATGAIQRWYAHGLGSNDALNQMNVAAGTRATLVPGQLGSIVATLDSGSGALTKAGYLPYGGSASSAGTFRFTGQRIDGETGLYYYRARMYSPKLGRFVQVDPIGEDGGVNLYAYVLNDPLNFVDPSGLVAADVGRFVSTSLYSLSRIPSDIARVAEDFVNGPLSTVANLLAPFPATRAGSAGATGIAAIRALGGRAAPAALVEEAFHYTSSGAAASIRETGLRPGSYATTAGGLSPLQAQIDLALPPNRGLPAAQLRIDVGAMRRAGYDVPLPSQVTRSFNMPGGGTEMFFPYPIPPQFISTVRP
jgi:RHS repeat-associated protein